MPGDKKLLGMHPVFQKPWLILGLRGMTRKGQKKKGYWGNQESKIAKAINQFKNIFPSLLGSTRVLREQAAFLIPQSEHLSTPQGMRWILPPDPAQCGYSGPVSRRLGRRGTTQEHGAGRPDSPGRPRAAGDAAPGWGCSQLEGELEKGGQSAVWGCPLSEFQFTTKIT